MTTGASVRIDRFDLATDDVEITPDGASYAYAYGAFSSVLYLV